MPPRACPWSHKYSRNIVDESDENFSVKLEQIYIMGAQTLVDFVEEYPHSIEVNTHQLGGVPGILLLHRDAEEALLNQVATHTCNNGIDSLAIYRQSKRVRNDVLFCLTKQQLTPNEITAVETPGNGSLWAEGTKSPILLLRGLLAGGILPRRVQQNHTDALVLCYLLRRENSVVFEPEEVQPAKNAPFLLDLVLFLDPPVQVILDVGAQILEQTNLEVAKHWLQALPRNGPIKAIGFVDDDDEICVLDQKGVELLHNSPYARQMEAFHVFLDEAHSRGIDLKLPPSYRAVVTLGHGITKDKLVQACMRMRKLAKGKSVVFYVPRDIHFKILALTGKPTKSVITVSDVLRWAVSETWAETRRNMPVWATQGRDLNDSEQDGIKPPPITLSVYPKAKQPRAFLKRNVRLSSTATNLAMWKMQY
ncbi:Protein of unknown function DUF3638 [Penicillium camemberti]|uniref:ubiquitinyl hydrolase 1 n=1 Tax=Penicillium camemberti (strain FM 013) TaxID=1429867 RepID=A0A0G4P037_PENC3|nr:Protein of unknown function DUF3638 [Penicillium camemberti]